MGLEMNERKKAILNAIIKEYILSAEPVGSRALSRKYHLGISPATIRNEMADLEEQGYLEQPHISAGRVPSDKGYRFYVDSLLACISPQPEMIKAIQKSLGLKQNSIQEIIENTSKMVSRLTRYTTLVLGPAIKKSKFKYIQLLPIGGNGVLSILVTDTGMVQNRVLRLPHSMSRGELDQISAFLNERLNEMPIDCIDNKMFKEMEQELINRFDLYRQTLEVIEDEIIQELHQMQENIYLGGTTYILDQPEFKDVEKVKIILKALEEEEILHNMISSIDANGIEVTIGHENPLEEFQNLSLVTATYNLGQRQLGKISVLGPTRMEYSRVINSVRIVSSILSEILTEK
ncbi:MAG: heat-inducible transcriptional repressor HrcA [Halanaerobium sp.]|nr:heat-inducible transcriptional repressor HrcA [Halanaerobium sp.]